MNRPPALLGNSPIFNSQIPIARPALPEYFEVAEELRQILESGVLTNGPHARAFEEMLAAHLGVKHAVAVSSCTSGLMLVYQALGLTGDVIVPSFTFMATVSALRWNGLRPVFADVDSETTNLNPQAAEVAITAETTAIVAVSNAGNPADFEEFEALASRRHLRLIFDAAHAFGSLYQGTPVGRQGDAQVFSLSPTKLLIANEGGVVATNDDALAEKVRIGREYGNRGDYDSAFAGINARLPEVNALLGKHSLGQLESAALHRNLIAELYRERLSKLPGVGFQTVRRGNRSSYKDFSVTIDGGAFGLTRDELAKVLAAENIQTRKYYDPPVHRQTAYRDYAVGASLANTELLALRILSLPIWSHMDADLASRICLGIERAHEFAEQIRAASRHASAV
jgi:dTDP-4-amino-4,6-dideoxygalactose transaminase